MRRYRPEINSKDSAAPRERRKGYALLRRTAFAIMSACDRYAFHVARPRLQYDANDNELISARMRFSAALREIIASPRVPLFLSTRKRSDNIESRRVKHARVPDFLDELPRGDAEVSCISERLNSVVKMQKCSRRISRSAGASASGYLRTSCDSSRLHQFRLFPLPYIKQCSSSLLRAVIPRGR